MSSIKAIALAKVVGGGGGGGEITLETLNVDANATYNASLQSLKNRPEERNHLEIRWQKALLVNPAGILTLV